MYFKISQTTDPTKGGISTVTAENPTAEFPGAVHQKPPTRLRDGGTMSQCWLVNGDPYFMAYDIVPKKKPGLDEMPYI